MKFIEQLTERFKLAGMSRRTKVFIGLGAVALLLILVFVNSLIEMNDKAPQKPKVNLVPQKERPKKNLDYDFIKLDTLQIPRFTQREQTPPPLPPAAPNNFPGNPPPGRQPQEPKSAPSNAPLFPEPATTSSQGVNRNPNMIVMNNLSQNALPGGGSTASAFATGRETALIKVVIPDRTPVADGSLVIARVLRDSKWGNINLPRRTKLIGTASLYNNRVHIDFREVMINDSSRSCTGKAYDLKQMEGIGYSPVSNEAKQILMEELRNATLGVPVVGNVANRALYSGNYFQDVAELEEGLEFYALISAIY